MRGRYGLPISGLYQSASYESISPMQYRYRDVTTAFTIVFCGGHGRSAKLYGLVVPLTYRAIEESQCDPSIVDNSPGVKVSIDTGYVEHTTPNHGSTVMS